MFTSDPEVQMYEKSQRSAVRSHDCCGSSGTLRHLKVSTNVSVAHRDLAPSALCDLHKSLCCFVTQTEKLSTRVAFISCICISVSLNMSKIILERHNY